MKRALWSLIALLATLLALGGGSIMARSADVQLGAVLEDREPNDSCATAQDLGTFAGPLELVGGLVHDPYLPPEAEADRIDFFRLTVTSGLRLRLEVVQQGTFFSPRVGVFSTGCELLAAADAGYWGSAAALGIIAPADGVIIVAVTSSNDPTFSGSSNGGEYSLKIWEGALIGGISGSLIDSSTGWPPYTMLEATLQRCEADACTTMWTEYVYGGSFTFWPSPYGRMLFAGTYRITVYGDRYKELTIGPFDVGPDEHKTLDPAMLLPAPAIFGISGSLIDSSTGGPVADGYWVELQRCRETGCSTVRQATLSSGQFTFNSDPYWGPLYAGRYQIAVNINRFEPATIGPFTVEGGESKVLEPVVLTRIPEIAGISGSLVDNVTGQPPSDILDLQLQRCSDGACTTMWSGFSFDGAFSFESGPYGAPLYVGEYQVVVSHERYQPLTIGPFAVGAGEFKALGATTIVRKPVFRSIRGQLVNAITGAPPLSFGSAEITLLRCVDAACYDYYYFSETGPDPEGNFSFSQESVYRPLLTGMYKITFRAEQFAQGSVGPFTIGANEELDLGRVPMQPAVIQFFNLRGCPPIPASGGSCTYSVGITNGRDKTVQLKVWSIINTSIDNGSQFQPEVAKTLNLRPGEMRTVSFKVEVPQALPANSSFCGTVYAADLGFGHLFLPHDSTTVFCSAKSFDDVVWPLPLEKARSLQSHLAGFATGTQTPR